MIPRSYIPLLLSSLFSASILAQSILLEPQITAAPSQRGVSPSRQIPTVSTIPSSLPVSTTSLGAWDGLVSSAEYLLDELSEHLHVDLRKRQGGVAATHAPQPTTVATQMPTVTTYGADRGWTPVVYTQTFVAVPDQWPSPESGAIGLGTIPGTYGVIKTVSKRMAAPQSTGQVIRIKGREIVVP